MTTMDIYNMVTAGKRVLVRFTKFVEELDMQFDENMLAEIVSAKIEDGEIMFVFDETKFSKMNKDLEKANWPDKQGVYCKKFSEINFRKDRDTFWEGEENEPYYFAVIDKNLELIEQYLQTDKEFTYIEWLEEKIFSDGLV